ncbi:titin-like [Euwallacea fornicatus]|uniref:titin-like n=1 Tax=Euwallacea fornicatus TaxID=995702 RepID=UPI00338F97D2
MPINVMIQLCNITRQSRLFQRNFYLPLLKPLSPKDALRIHIITGKDVLARALEHWIPVFEEYAARVQRRRHMPKGVGKKRQRKKDSMKYLSPFFDDKMENHGKLENTIIRKSKGRGQCYTYYVPEKKCTLVLTHQWERAIRDKDIVDIVIAQRHEKIIVKMRDGTKVTMPLCPYDGKAPFYRGEGWTRKEVEEHHHHGKETFSIAQLFEAKEAGIEEWELEMMRMANKRKKKMKGEDSRDWKTMLAATTSNMDWDAFEEESKQIVDESNEPIDDEPIAMVLDDIEKTCDVNEKLKAAGDEILALLPIIPEIPEILKVIKDQSEITEIANVSGARVSLSAGSDRFVPGQMVTSEDGELFVPGQTVVNESGEREYTPGFTVLLDDEPTLIPGLVMGNDPEKSMFLPGESVITESGELQFAATDDDIIPHPPTPPPEEKEVDEVELEEDQNSEEEEIEQRPPPKPKRKELTYEVPKREFNPESMGPKHRVRGPKKLPPVVSAIPQQQADNVRRKTIIETKIFDLQTPTFEKDFLEQEKERVEAFKEKTGKEEAKVDKQRREIKLKAKKLMDSKPPTPKYEPLEPVRKSEKLREYEKNIKKGKFFDVDYKKFLTKEHNGQFYWLDTYQYRNTFDTVGIRRHRVWKSVYYYGAAPKQIPSTMPINVKISLCKITRASKLFQRNYYLPLLKPLSPKDALRRKIITGENVLGARIEHYIPVLKPHDEKLAEKKKRGKGVPVIKKKIKRHEGQRYVEPFMDENMDGHVMLQGILHRKPKGRGQKYVYEIADKGCNLVIPYQMEKAIKDKDIIDITIAQRSEKIVLKLANGMKVTVPVAPLNDNTNLYRGSGWTKEVTEQEHHHGKETFSIAKLFEAKESGVEEWELEMMRLANKRKKKVKGEDNKDWKAMLNGCLENMDWDKFEEDTKQIVEEQEETVEEEDIPMEVDDMEKTRHVNEKLKAGGDEVLEQLPTMLEIPKVIKNLESGEMEEMLNVSGARVQIPEGRSCFVPGQIVKTDENEIFVPGQTVDSEDGTEEYTPGITVLLDGEPTLIPGLVMGEEESQPMFLPGESTITGEGQLKFEVTEEDLPPARRRRELTPSPPPPPKPKPRVIKDEDIVIKRRTFDEPEPVIKERVKKRPQIDMKPRDPTPPRDVFRPQRQPVDDPLIYLEEQRRLREEEERKRMKERNEEKMLKEEFKVTKLRMDIKKMCKDIKIEKPGKYEPLEPVKKSAKLEELELSIKKGTFFDDDKTKEILEKAKSQTRLLKYQKVLPGYGNDFDFRRH